MERRPRTPGEPPGFSSLEVCREAGLTFRILDYWDRTGVLRPSLRASRGQGSKRRYSAEDMWVARLLNILRQMGAGRDALTAAAQATRLEDLSGGLVHISPLGEVTKDLAVAGASWACWWTVGLGARLEDCHPEGEMQDDGGGHDRSLQLSGVK